MAASRNASRWGSFLSQAVAGVESRLDNILAEGSDDPGAPRRPTTAAATGSATPRSEGGISRSASGSNRTTNDRLQERLARAIAAKNSAQKDKIERADSLALSSGEPSRSGTPINTTDDPRASLDVASLTEDEKDTHEEPAPIESKGRANTTQDDTPSILVSLGIPNGQPAPAVRIAPETNGSCTKSDSEMPARPSVDSIRSSPHRPSMDSVGGSDDLRSRTVEDIQSSDLPDIVRSTSKTPAEYHALLSQLQSDYEASELQRQEEIHNYIERIDALQSKLQYLAKENAENARIASGAALSGSPDKKLADKEEQVALLMQEGQQLSRKELAHLTTIKKLKAKIQEDGKELAEAKRKQEKAEKDAERLAERNAIVEASEKRLQERQKQIPQLQRTIDTLISEKAAKDAIIATLTVQLEEAVSEGLKAENQATQEKFQAEQRRVAELEDDIANLRIEKNLVGDRAQAQIKELKEKMEKDVERYRVAELEMKSEQQMLESKLEVMRARAEEVSSGATGDAQAKFLRQIETLQTQYAVASENWQGIEASMLARVTSLEKERDEATRREADIRRKAREVTLKAKRNEDELEESRSQMPGFHQQLTEYKQKLGALQRRAEEAESALIEARSTFEQEKSAWRSEMQQRLEEEKQKWQEDVSATYSRAESPVLSTRRGLTSEYLGLQNLQIRRASGRSMNEVPPPSAGFLASHRPSIQPLARSSGNGTPARQDSMQSLKQGTDSVSIHTDNDDFFQSPSSPHQTINDMISTSTAGAGPSVQLVERMSSAVRRLESEKVATKEDITRLSAQRDEARAEIVSLMREVETKRAADARVAQLEAELKQINQRYETTLEMLGEKSELVDELKSDIDDIKAMYRELVERTVR